MLDLRISQIHLCNSNVINTNVEIKIRDRNNIMFISTKFRESLFAINHVDTSYSSTFILLTNTSIDLSARNTLVPSANIIN